MFAMPIPVEPADNAVTAAERIQQILHSGDQATWLSTALVLVLRDCSPDARRQAAAELLDALGLHVADAPTDLDRVGVAAQAAAPLLQTAALLTGDGQLWAGQPDEALIAQGRASAQGAEAFRRFGLPALPGLAEALASPDSQMLDVGTGVGALAVAYAELFPTLTVVGLDVLPRVLDLAAETVAASEARDRVILREQDVSTLTDGATFTLAWLPAPFLSETSLSQGVHRVVRALLPGGWIMLGHGKYTADAVENSFNRFKTVAYGGTALDDTQAQTLLRNAGLTAVTTIATPPGAPAITVGQKTK